MFPIQASSWHAFETAYAQQMPEAKSAASIDGARRLARY